ncbi:DNA-binding response regulator [Streptomyces sp. NPDC092296]|uniref:DNA-binding response regulator n=1 Tax=Streptomyces sp. NPDC092296 TaxID=3366012 RepID=UPI0037F5375D
MQGTATLNRERAEGATATLAPHRPGANPPAPPRPVPAAGLLAPEEHRLLLLLAEGLPLDAVARRLCTSSRTLRRRIRVLCDRLGVRTPLQAAVWAARRGLI